MGLNHIFKHQQLLIIIRISLPIPFDPPRDTINKHEFAEYYGGIIADIDVKYETETPIKRSRSTYILYL